MAAARLVAHYVDAALRAGADESEIHEVLHTVASELENVEFWVTDEHGRITIGCHPMNFAFPDNTDAETQAAPFAPLLDGTKAMVVQEPRPRELDGRLFQYVGVPGVARPRIVQMGVPVGGTRPWYSTTALLPDSPWSPPIHPPSHGNRPVRSQSLDDALTGR